MEKLQLKGLKSPRLISLSSNRYGTKTDANFESFSSLPKQKDDEENLTLENFVRKKALSDYFNGEIEFKEYLRAKNFPKTYAKSNKWTNSPNKTGSWDKRMSVIIGKKAKLNMNKLKNLVNEKISLKKSVKASVYQNSDLYAYSGDQTLLFKNYYQICNDFSLRIKNKDLIGDNPELKYYESNPKKKVSLSHMTLICEKKRAKTERNVDKFLNSNVFQELERIVNKKPKYIQQTQTEPTNFKSQSFRKMSFCKEYINSNKNILQYQSNLKQKTNNLELYMEKMGFGTTRKIKPNTFKNIPHNKILNESIEYSDDSDLPSVTEHVLEDYYSKSIGIQKLFQENSQTNVLKKLQQIMKLHEIQRSISKVSNSKITLKGKFI